AAAATAASPATASAESAFRLRPRFIDDKRPTVHLLLVELSDGFLRLIVARHLHEGEAARAARRHVPHHADVVDLAGPAEELRQLLFRGRVGEVSDVESPAHTVTYSWLNARLRFGRSAAARGGSPKANVAG